MLLKEGWILHPGLQGNNYSMGHPQRVREGYSQENRQPVWKGASSHSSHAVICLSGYSPTTGVWQVSVKRDY